MLERVELGLSAVVAMALALTMPLLGQNSQTTAPETTAPETGTIMGTVTDVNGDTIPNATVALRAADGKVSRTIVTPENADPGGPP